MASVWIVHLLYYHHAITKSQVLYNRKLMLEMASDMLALTMASTLDGSPERKQLIDKVNQINERGKDLLRQMERAGVKTK
ncbi:MAG: hypothetical protein K8963_09260 [Proteobacteria bacterium]|nr:hypothetical protein [Pseudomonadota bacterium]